MTLFALPDDQIAIRDMARAFAAERIAPKALDWDEAKHLPLDVLREAAALGMGGVYIGEDVGGSGPTRLDAPPLFEGLATGCPPGSALLSVPNKCAREIGRYRAGAQPRRRLPG